MIHNLDPLFHDRTRLGILIMLLREEEVDFNTLKKTLELTDGNLATHLRKLEQAGIVEYRKTFVGRRPRTYYRLTDEGREKFLEYLSNLRSVLEKLKEEG